MAYENGYEIIEYFGENIDKYKQDPSIFMKSLSILNTYMNRTDWPHCFEEMANTVEPYLGDSIVRIGFTGYYLEDVHMEWPSDIHPNYKKDAIAFYKTVQPIINQYYFSREEPFGLYSIVGTSKNHFEDRRIIRFVRNDGKSLELQINNNDLKEMIDLLNDIMEEE